MALNLWDVGLNGKIFADRCMRVRVAVQARDYARQWQEYLDTLRKDWPSELQAIAFAEQEVKSWTEWAEKLAGRE